MSKIKVAVLFGGASSEHDISLVSATNIINNIPKDKYEVICIGITKKGRWLYYPGDVNKIASGEWKNNPDCTPAIISPDPMHKGIIKLESEETSFKRIDVVFPAIHGANGEDGALQGLFELAKLPYVGCDLGSSAVCIDKALTHTVLEAAGIKMAKWRVLTQSDLNGIDKKCVQIASELGFPLFVKPACSGSSIGVNKAYDLESLEAAVKLAFSHSKKVIVEEFICGRELEVAILGQDLVTASAVGEICSCNDFYDYDAKYVLSSSKLCIPAQLELKVSDEIRQTAVKAYKAAGCAGLSRVDFFLTNDNKIILNEINTMPGFTPISMYSKLMEDAGLDCGELLDRLITIALDRHQQ